MKELSNEERFLRCRKKYTAECPYLDEPAMKRIRDADKFFPAKEENVDMLSIKDYKNAESLCGKCDAFENK